MTNKIHIEGFYEFSFENGQEITAQELKAIYDKKNYFINIDLTEERFSPKITLFSATELNEAPGGIIRIDNQSSKTSLLVWDPNSQPIKVMPGDTCSVHGTKNYGWAIHFS
ncbi:hypothetical protein, partial [Proteus myxofaciens]|uniref:hypothetical protein n=1 Tax=Proteus myxofaciens TaxID=184072 RepID=UPI000836A4D8